MSWPCWGQHSTQLIHLPLVGFCLTRSLPDSQSLRRHRFHHSALFPPSIKLVWPLIYWSSQALVIIKCFKVCHRHWLKGSKEWEEAPTTSSNQAMRGREKPMHLRAFSSSCTRIHCWSVPSSFKRCTVVFSFVFTTDEDKLSRSGSIIFLLFAQRRKWKLTH